MYQIIYVRVWANALVLSIYLSLSIWILFKLVYQKTFSLEDYKDVVCLHTSKSEYIYAYDKCLDLL